MSSIRTCTESILSFCLAGRGNLGKLRPRRPISDCSRVQETCFLQLDSERHCLPPLDPAAIHVSSLRSRHTGSSDCLIAGYISGRGCNKCGSRLLALCNILRLPCRITFLYPLTERCEDLTGPSAKSCCNRMTSVSTLRTTTQACLCMLPLVRNLS